MRRDDAEGKEALGTTEVGRDGPRVFRLVVSLAMGAALLLAGPAFAEWSPLGAGCDDTVRATVPYDGELVAGGYFRNAGGVGANYIASWNGSTWRALGGGLNGAVFALTVHDGLLIAAGDFSAADGSPANRIAAWDGSSWASLGWSYDEAVFALATTQDGHLYAGGGKLLQGHIVELDTMSPPTWHLIGDMDAPVLTLWEDLDFGGLIAGGTFNRELSSGYFYHIARWDGSQWSELGPGMNQDVWALASYEGQLIAGGEFSQAGGTTISRIAAWDGSSWNGIGGGCDDVVDALTVYDGDLIVGGEFYHVGGVAAQGVAKWNGTAWSALGSGLDGYAFALSVYEDGLIAAGNFRSAGGVAAERIAHWEVPPAPPGFALGQSFEGLARSEAAWGDMDNDGDLDLVLCGDTGSEVVTRTYRNDGGTLVIHPTNNLPGVHNHSSDCVAWADMDGSGIDLAVAGYTGTERIARVYNTVLGTLQWDTTQSLVGVSGASLGWCDFDQDGDADLYLQGYSDTGPVAILYRNDEGTLTPAANLTALYSGSVDWADVDGDGDFDLLCTGYDGAANHTICYRNDPMGTLTADGSRGLPGVHDSDVATGDFDNDGDLDVAITGRLPYVTAVYENDGAGNFTPHTVMAPVYRLGKSSCAWGDYDNDGDLDVVFTGFTGSVARTDLYENTGSGFHLTTISLPDLNEGSASWADFDRDGDLDLLVTGRDDQPQTRNHAILYENTIGTPNVRPSAPENLSCSQVGRYLSFSWDPGHDEETAAAGLYYCLRVGVVPTWGNNFSKFYDTPLMGNVGQATEVLVKVPVGTFYWNVRTIDAGLAVSKWSPTQSCVRRGKKWNFEESVLDSRKSGGPNASDWARAESDAPALDGASAIGDPSGLGDDCARELDPSRPYYVCTEPLWGDYSTHDFSAEIWFANRSETSTHAVTVELRRGSWGEEGMLLATATSSIVGSAPRRATFEFGGIPGLVLAGESLVVKIIYEGTAHDGYILRNRPGAPSALLAGATTDTSPAPDGNDVPGMDAAPVIPGVQLGANYPNPFNPSTRIEYTLPAERRVSLRVYDASGRLVRTLVDRVHAAGPHSISWHGRSDTGARVASGVYYCRLVVGTEHQVRRMVLLK